MIIYFEVGTVATADIIMTEYERASSTTFSEQWASFTNKVKSSYEVFLREFSVQLQIRFRLQFNYRFCNQPTVSHEGFVLS